MKKNIIQLVAVLAIGMLAFTACKKCEDCSYLGSTDTEYCGSELTAAKAAGWNCN